MSAFIDLYASLPRQGPGDRVTLDHALSIVGPGDGARVMDAGCGTGADIDGLLAWVGAGHVTAVDNCAPFIGVAEARYSGEPRVTAFCGNMADVTGPFDLIWSAGALYFLGLEQGLGIFREKLVQGGCLAFSHPAYFLSDPSDRARRLWDGEGEVLQSDAVSETVRASGYDILDAASLPDSAWEAYYGPLEDRISELLPVASGELKDVLEAAGAEIESWRSAKGETGYVQIVAQRT